MIKIKRKRIFLFIILSFLILNLSWFLIITIKYNKFIKAVPKNEHDIYFMQEEDGYCYSVKKPNYLHYTGNLAVVNYAKGEHLIIWPLISGGYKYGIRFEADGRSFEAYVDEDMNPIHNDDENSAQVIKEHKDELENLFSKADKLWNLK